MMQSSRFRSILGITGFALLGLGLWHFKSLLGLLLFSVVLSFIGRPIVLLVNRIQIRGRKVSSSIGAVVALGLMIGFCAGIIQLFVPLVSEQVQSIRQIDREKIEQLGGQGLDWLDHELATVNLSGDEQSNSAFIISRIQSSLEFRQIGLVLSDLLSSIGDLLFGCFAVVFMTFFFLRDGALFRKMVEALTPDEFTEKTRTIMTRTSKLLTRYSGGLVIQMIIITSIVSIGLSIAGVEHAFLIGLLAGFCNLVPYLGPIAGTIVGLTLALVNPDVTAENFNAIFWSSLSVFVVAQLVDNFFTQPIVFANRVHAHPLEIFLVISVSGSLAGVIGMILAVPLYTFFRIIAQELFSGFKVIDRLTQGLK